MVCLASSECSAVLAEAAVWAYIVAVAGFRSATSYSARSEGDSEYHMGHHGCVMRHCAASVHMDFEWWGCHLLVIEIEGAASAAEDVDWADCIGHSGRVSADDLLMRSQGCLKHKHRSCSGRSSPRGLRVDSAGRGSDPIADSP